jgi:hypothetical protein
MFHAVKEDRFMNRLHSGALMACFLGVSAVAACSGDDSDNPNGTGATGGTTGGKGGSAGKGGKGGSAGKGGKGGTAGDGSGGTTGGSAGKGGAGKGGSGGKGGSSTGGKGGSGGSEAGTGNDGGTGNEGGDGNPPDTCDVYADRTIMDIPTDVDGNLDTGSGTEFTLTSDVTWRLNGRTWVGDGQTLNIEPCTLIVGTPKNNPEAGALFIARGGKINAVGTADEPIVFSSHNFQFNTATPWGGVVLLGKAPIGEGATAQTVPERIFEGLADARATYGGEDAEDDSGTMQYVRIEYGGDIIVSDKEINGLTLAGVGRGTTLDHIMVKRQRDDCFEFFGGTVDAHHLICENTGDDMFDTDEMYKGYLQFLFGRLTLPGTSSDPNGLEWDGNQPNTAAAARGTPHAANVTLCGLQISSGAASYGAVLRRGLQDGTLVANTIVTGFATGLDTRDAIGTTTPMEPLVIWKNGLFFENFTNVIAPATEATDNDSMFDELAFINDAAYANGTTKPDGFDCYADPPAPFPTTAVSGAAAGDGFQNPDADYIGAFEDADDNWITGLWVDWSSGS